jgi:hypothetical protein
MPLSNDKINILRTSHFEGQSDVFDSRLEDAPIAEATPCDQDLRLRELSSCPKNIHCKVFLFFVLFASLFSTLCLTLQRISQLSIHIHLCSMRSCWTCLSAQSIESRPKAVTFAPMGPVEISLSLEWRRLFISENSARSLPFISEKTSPPKDVCLFLSFALRYEIPSRPLSLAQTDMEHQICVPCWIKDHIATRKLKFPVISTHRDLRIKILPHLSIPPQKICLNDKGLQQTRFELCHEMDQREEDLETFRHSWVQTRPRRKVCLFEGSSSMLRNDIRTEMVADNPDLSLSSALRLFLHSLLLSAFYHPP